MQQIQLTAPAAVPTSYGIQRAIELMRALPVDDDPSLVLRVVRKTLRSTGVSLEEIVSTARDREAAVVKGIESDRAAIEQLEIQIATRRANITRLEGDLEETREVRARIQEALDSETKVGPALDPEDLMRIRAEAGLQKPVPPPIPKGDTPPAPSTAPLSAKKASPVVASKPPPKLPSAVAPMKRDAKPIPKAPEPKIETKIETKSDTKPTGREPMSSVPDLGEIDDGFEEPQTAEVLVPVVRGKSDD